MKHRTRKTALILSAGLLLSLTACGQKEDPKKILDEAIAKNAALTDMDAATTMDMTIAQGEETLEMSTDMAIKVSGMNTDSMLYYSESTMDLSMLGQEQPLEVISFYKDGYCYTETYGQKIKYAMDLETMMETVNQSVNTASNLQSDMMTELTLEEKDGRRILTYTADAGKMNEQVLNALGALGDQMNALQGAEMTITGVSGTYTINEEGYYTALTMQLDYEMTVEGMTIAVGGDIQMDIHNPGEPVEITLPDTSDYQEMTLAP